MLGGGVGVYAGGGSGNRGGEHSCQYQIVTSGAAYSGVPCSPVSVPPSSPAGTHAAQCKSATHTSYSAVGSFLRTCAWESGEVAVADALVRAGGEGERPTDAGVVHALHM